MESCIRGCQIEGGDIKVGFARDQDKRLFLGTSNGSSIEFMHVIKITRPILGRVFLCNT